MWHEKDISLSEMLNRWSTTVSNNNIKMTGKIILYLQQSDPQWPKFVWFHIGENRNITITDEFESQWLGNAAGEKFML